MICVEDQSCKTEVSTLRDTLLHQLSTQDSNLEAIENRLKDGFTTINQSLREVHSKLDSLKQKMVDLLTHLILFLNLNYLQKTLNKLLPIEQK